MIVRSPYPDLAIPEMAFDRFVLHKAAALGDKPALVDIGTGYTLAGVQVTGGDSAAYHGPICAGACIDAQYQPFLDQLWNWNAKNLSKGYYDTEIQLLSMVVASGNWWSPVGALRLRS